MFTCHVCRKQEATVQCPKCMGLACSNCFNDGLCWKCYTETQQVNRTSNIQATQNIDANSRVPNARNEARTFSPDVPTGLNDQVRQAPGNYYPNHQMSSSARSRFTIKPRSVYLLVVICGAIIAKVLSHHTVSLPSSTSTPQAPGVQQGNGTYQQGEAFSQARPGDTWRYSVTGNATKGGQSVTLTGTSEQEISKDTVTTPQGAIANILLITSSLTDPSGNETTNRTEAYFTQDSDGQFWQYGGKNNGQIWWVTTPLGRAKTGVAQLWVGCIWRDSIPESTGNSRECTGTVTGRERTTVPAGTFDTYVCIEQGQMDGVSTKTTFWYAPHILGTGPVQYQAHMTGNLTKPDITFSEKLVSYNRGY